MTKIYLITGTSSGLGRCLALEILTAGGIVFSISRKPSDIDQNALQNFENFYSIEHDFNIELDLESIDLLKKLRGFERIIFISNAGVIKPILPLDKILNNDITESLMVNVRVPIQITQYLLRNYQKTNIDFVNITSGASKRNIANWSLYSSCKAFMQRFFDVVAEENRQSINFKFMHYDPGMLDTKMQADIRASLFPDNSIFTEAKENGKLISPENAAKLLLKVIN